MQISPKNATGTPLQSPITSPSFLFDLDGTLVHTDSAYFLVWKEILKTYNVELTYEMYHSVIAGNSDKTVVETILPLNIHQINEIRTMKETLFQKHLSTVSIVPGSKEILATIKSHEYKTALVTNSNRNTAEAVLRHCGLYDFFDCIVVGEECSLPKPYGEPYKKALRIIESTPDNTFIFEDSKTGLLSAKNINPRCIVGITTHYSIKELLTNYADFCVGNFEELDIPTLLAFTKDVHPQDLKEHIERSIHWGSAFQTGWNVTVAPEIEIDDTKLKGGFISDVLSVVVKVVGTAIPPLECVVKIENKEPNFLSTMSRQMSLYEREYYFYDMIAKDVPIPIPKCYGLVRNEGFIPVGILMENLRAKGYKIGLDLNEPGRLTHSLNIIHHLVILHAKYWNRPIQNLYPKIKKNNDPETVSPFMTTFMKERWPAFKSRWNRVLNEDNFALGERIVEQFADIQNYLSENKNLTLIHGDVKSANIFFDETTPYFLDWQYVAQGKGVQDLVFFMIESFQPSKARTLLPLFKEFYYVGLLEKGVRYERDDFEKDFRMASYFFPFFVAVWFGTLETDELIDKNFPLFFIQRLFSMWKAMGADLV